MTAVVVTASARGLPEQVHNHEIVVEVVLF